VFEFLLSEWGLSPDYIVNHWTHELFDMMVDKLVERKQRESQGVKQPGQVKDKELFNRMGKLVKVVKRGDKRG
jgi:hypothetical protein